MSTPTADPKLVPEPPKHDAESESLDPNVEKTIENVTEEDHTVA